MHTQQNQELPAASRWLKKRGRRGVAILLTLGILSLLLIMAMGFLFNSSTSRSVSIVNADAVRAKMLADSALQRFVAMVERDFSTISDMNPGVGFYAPAAGDWAGRRYVATVATGGATVEGTDSPLYAAFETSTSGTFLDFTPKSLSTDANLSANVQWVNVTTGKDISATAGAGTDTVARVIGRYCILGIDETGKIDPSAVVTSATETALGGGDTGVDFSEIFIGNAFSTTLTDGQSAEYYAGAAVPKWDSWYHLIKGGITTLGSTGQLQVASQSLFPHSREIEAFADYTDSTITKHRFDLSQSQAWWDAAAYTDLTTAASNFDGASTGGIQWLANGTGPDDRRTIAAMCLKDYCDADKKCTNAGGTSYMTGMERVPYMNEFRIVVTPPAVSPGNATISLEIEWANLYDTAFTDASAQVAVLVKWDNGTNVTTGQEWIIGDVSGVNFPAKSYTTTSVPMSTAVGPAVTGNFVLNVEILQAQLRDSGATTEVWDSARVAMSTGGFSHTIGGLANHRYANVKDPRCNQRNGTSGGSTYWGWSWWSLATATPGGGSLPTWGERNSMVNVAQMTNGTNDVESATALGAATGAAIDSFSTAYIRNAPMESLWELGAICTGLPYQTINLSTFNAGAQYQGTHALGDANILDHVKLTSNDVVDGKLNANSKYELALRALIGHVNLGANYSTSGASGTRDIGVSDWTAGTNDDQAGYQLATAIMAANGNFQNRGQVATIAALSDTTPQPSGGYSIYDAQEEELIGKIAHHLTTRSNWFSVIVCSQAIQPELYAARTEVKVLAESKKMAVVYRDVFTGETRVDHVQPLGE